MCTGLIRAYKDEANYEQGTRLKDIAIVTEFMYSVERLRQRTMTEEYLVGFVGLGNVGKSTILNSLFGVAVAPRKNKPMTALCVEYRYGDQWLIEIRYKNTFRTVTRNCSGPEDLLDCVEEYATENGSHVDDPIQSVKVWIPSELLSKGLVIADTPGFGAVHDHHTDRNHEEILLNYIPRFKNIYWVINKDQGITAKEHEFYKTYLKDQCDNLVVTACEDLEEDDRERFKAHYNKKLGLHFMKCDFVSGKRGWSARVSGNTDELQESGICSLHDQLSNLGDMEERNSILLNELVDRINEFSSYFQNSETKAVLEWPTTALERMIYAAKPISFDRDGMQVNLADYIGQRFK